MSSITMFARGDRAVILTDTAGTDRNFIVRSWTNKVATVPHLRLAMTAQGAAEALSTFADRLTCELGGLDAILRDGAAVLRDEHDENLMRWSDNAASPEFKLGIVGWSEERQRFEAHMIQSTDSLGVPPFQFVRRDLLLAPMLHESDLTAMRIPSDGKAFAADAAAYLLRIIQAQRRWPQTVATLYGEVQRYGIGGEVICTELCREGISQRVVHRWSDALGDPIQLEPVPAELLQSVPPEAERNGREWGIQGARDWAPKALAQCGAGRHGRRQFGRLLDKAVRAGAATLRNEGMPAHHVDEWSAAFRSEAERQVGQTA